MLNISTDSLKWQMIRDVEGSRLEVVCPLCGERVLHRLDDLDVDETDVISFALENHMDMCKSDSPVTVDVSAKLAEAGKELNNEDIESDVLVVGADGQIWHITQGNTVDGEPFCAMEVIASDPLLIDDNIVSQEYMIAVAEYSILVLEAAKQCLPPAI